MLYAAGAASALRPHETVEERPRQDEAREAVEDAARPVIEGAMEEQASVEEPAALLGGFGRNLDKVKEDGRQERHDDVDEKAAVGFEAEDAGGDAKERGCDGLEIRQNLRHD